MNYGMIHIDWDSTPVQIRLELIGLSAERKREDFLRDRSTEVVWSYNISLSELQMGVSPKYDLKDCLVSPHAIPLIKLSYRRLVAIARVFIVLAVIICTPILFLKTLLRRLCRRKKKRS